MNGCRMSGVKGLGARHTSRTPMNVKTFVVFAIIAGVCAGGCTSPHGGPAIYYPVASGLNAVFAKKSWPVEGSHGTSPATAFRFREPPDRSVELEEGYWLYHHCSIT